MEEVKNCEAITKEDLKNYKYQQEWLKDRIDTYNEQKTMWLRITQNWDNMPHGNSEVMDKMAESVAKLIDEYSELIEKLQDKIKAKIEEVKDGTFDAKIVLQSLLEKE